MKQEGQVALNGPKSLTRVLLKAYRNLLIADTVPSDIWGNPFLAQRALYEQTW